MIRRRYVTLLETLIAMALVSVILTTLMGFYSQLTGIQEVVEKAQKENYSHLFAQYRLNAIFAKVVGPLTKTGKEVEDFFFFTTGNGRQAPGTEALVFVYDNGYGAGPYFSNKLIGRLYLDEYGRLILASWPTIARIDDLRPPMMKEVLLTDVSDLRWSFYRPAAIEGKEKVIETENASQDDISSWSVNENNLPAILRLIVRFSDPDKTIQTAQFAHVLANTRDPVTYSF